MSTVILACQTIKDEVRLAIQETGVDYPVLYIESGLHNCPDLLMQKIQESISRLGNVKTILLAFGFCGNSLIGITSPDATLVIPRADDCISLLLGSYELRMSLSREMGTYFLTKGWLDNEQNLLTEYKRCVERYGITKASKVFKMMLNHYKRLMIIDTQAYELEEIITQTENFAQTMGIEHEKVNGSMRFLNKLLLGPWDEEFIIVKTGDTVALEHMGINGLDVKSDNQIFGFDL